LLILLIGFENKLRNYQILIILLKGLMIVLKHIISMVTWYKCVTMVVASDKSNINVFPGQYLSQTTLAFKQQFTSSFSGIGIEYKQS
jgi:hypothetical protein